MGPAALETLSSRLALASTLPPFEGRDPGATLSPAIIDVARRLAATPRPQSMSALDDLPPVGVSEPGVADPHADIALEASLGQGGMGRVDLGRQRAFDRAVAVKRVRPDRLCDTAVRALLDEARLTGALEHPNIVPAYVLGRSATGEPVLVMKRVEGVAWSELAADPSHPAWADRGDERLGRHVEIFLDVCHAVEFAHRHGVIHRDIKAENVMVGELGEVYLLDWGVAVREGDEPNASLAGTPSHMAPEMLAGTADVSRRTDVYLLGATLHAVLTGRPRHVGASILEVLGAAARSEPVDYPDTMPSELAAICNRATARDASDRFSSALELASAVRTFVRHRGALALAADADRRLSTLRDESACLSNRGAADATARVRRLSAECSFAYRLALRDWPESADARAGLRACIEHTVDFELRQRNASAAEVLLGELEGPSPALSQRLERLQGELRAEANARAALARMEAESDVFLDRANGGRSPAVTGAAVALVFFALSAASVPLSPAGNVVVCALSAVVGALSIYANRRALLFNRASTQRFLAVSSMIPFSLTIALFGWVHDTPASRSVEQLALGHALLAAVLGLTAAPLIAIGVPVYLAVAGFIAARPNEPMLHYGIYSLSHVVINRIEAAVVRRQRADPAEPEASA